MTVKSLSVSDEGKSIDSKILKFVCQVCFKIFL